MPPESSKKRTYEDTQTRQKDNFDRLVPPLPGPWAKAMERFFSGDWIKPAKHQQFLELQRIQQELKPNENITGETIKDYFAVISAIKASCRHRCTQPVICMDPSAATQLLDRLPGDPWPCFPNLSEIEKTGFHYILWPIEHNQHWSLVEIRRSGEFDCAIVRAHDSLSIVTGPRTSKALETIVQYLQNFNYPGGLKWENFDVRPSWVFGSLLWGQAQASNDGGVWSMLLSRQAVLDYWSLISVDLPHDEEERLELTKKIGQRARVRLAAEIIAKTTNLDDAVVPSWLRKNTSVE
ncbi:uncharacterized protein EI97DRAFT_487136 [Westerdykella ornata]|uniref:Ubiquitin-like protease family profile domain-containing protein n=1 Tax=Westerdykella ornata TaxID=318751 RepID=A0A6A6J8V9_WESOR|nr:uncharacterized protein EI97DRAFT_487136 [Westerdykella ornata]KAF2271639.1 hypothetical protein EI97DRAFT_487136 [Westerdykella ornata]